MQVDKEGNNFDGFFTSGQFGEDQKAFPSLAAFGYADTLEDGSERFEVAFRYTARPDDTDCLDPSVYEEDIGGDDTASKDPFGHFEANLGLDLAGPSVEGQEVYSSEGVGNIDKAGDNDENPQPCIREWGETGPCLEVRECLVGSVQVRGGRRVSLGGEYVQCSPISAPRQQ